MAAHVEDWLILIFFQTSDRGWPACRRHGRQTSARTKTSARLKITFVDMTYPKGWTKSLPLCPLSEVEVSQKPWTISLAQRWIRENRDQSKLIKKYLWKSSRLLHDWYSRCFISRVLVYLTFINIFQALLKITWRQKRRGKSSRTTIEWHIYFRIIMNR